MNYENYTVEDFIADEYFQQWVLEPEVLSNNFWEEWLTNHPDQAEVVEKAKQTILLLAEEEHKLSEQDFNAMWMHIENRKKDVVLRTRTRLSNGVAQYLRIAAMLAIVLLAVFAAYKFGMFAPKSHIVAMTQPQITLELQDGSVKVLDETVSGVISTSDGKSVVNQMQKVLDYTMEEVASGRGPAAYNQLTVPYGKKFELVLEDGSRVFLNSGTSLRYPVYFESNKPRNVFLDGEAFFEVSKDKNRPFTVITDQMNTQVYGTQFNVSSYKNELNTSTVLVEGSVGIYKANNSEGAQPVMLSPGERGVFEKDEIEVSQVNIEKYVAWKEGKLCFVNDRFDLIIKEIERHFNVVIVNNNDKLSERRFTGTFDVESLDQILHVFQMYTPFDYQRDNQKIIIKP